MLSFPPTIRTLLAGNDLPRLELAVLLGHAIGMTRAALLAHSDSMPTEQQLERFDALVRRRLAGEPIAYLVGEREFYSIALDVTPEVLIPRPETELLVELALERLRPGDTRTIADLGTGSGAIAIAIATDRPASRIVATDISEGALAVARRNAARHGIDNIRFLRSDWYDALRAMTFDIVASNPPYIADRDPHLSAGDLRFEPALAVRAGHDGLDAIRTIVAGAPARLSDSGVLMLEHGYAQGDAVRALLADAGFDDISTHRDFAGHERVTSGRRRVR